MLASRTFYRSSSSVVSMTLSLENYAVRQRRFAPLNPALAESSDAPQLKGIVFDVDGTLW